MKTFQLQILLFSRMQETKTKGRSSTILATGRSSFWVWSDPSRAPQIGRTWRQNTTSAMAFQRLRSRLHCLRCLVTGLELWLSRLHVVKGSWMLRCLWLRRLLVVGLLNDFARLCCWSLILWFIYVKWSSQASQVKFIRFVNCLVMTPGPSFWSSSTSTWAWMTYKGAYVGPISEPSNRTTSKGVDVTMPEKEDS